MELFFITGNNGKFISAKNILEKMGVNLVQMKLDIREPRSDTVKEISIEKAKQAYELVKKPVIVEDSGFIIDEFKNFPGPYVNFVLETIGINGILRLVGKNRKCHFTSVVTYYDGDTLKTFTLDDEPGTIAMKASEKENEEAWSDLWKIYIPAGHEKTLNDMSKEEYEECNKEYERISGFHLLAKWLGQSSQLSQD